MIGHFFFTFSIVSRVSRPARGERIAKPNSVLNNPENLQLPGQITKHLRGWQITEGFEGERMKEGYYFENRKKGF